MANSFLYKWFDKGRQMHYIGVHKGTANDGYICSSKIMLEEIAKRPEDFNRTIISYGSFEDMIQEETKILKCVDAAKNKNYYNQHNGDGNFFCKEHSDETKNKISIKLKQYKKTDKHCKAISDSKIGKTMTEYNRRSYSGSNNPNFGKKPSTEVCSMLHEKFSKKYAIEGKLYTGLSEVMSEFKLKSRAAVFYRINSNSEKFKDWNYGN